MVLALLCCAGLLLAAGCAGVSGSSASVNPITLQLSTWGSAEEMKVTRALIREFEATHPDVRVELLHIPDNYYQKLHILVAGGLTPDVVFTNSISFPVYASQGIFQDLTPYLARQNATLKAGDFFAPSLEAFTWKGDPKKPLLGALPRDVSNLVMFYNKDLFQKAGVAEPSPNWTWAEFLKTAQKLTIDQNRDGMPEQFGVSFYATPPLFWLPFVWTAGGGLFSENLASVTLSDSASISGLQFYADLRNRYHVAPTQIQSGGATMSQLFMQRKIAMMVNGRWSVPVLREQADFDWDVVPLPRGPGGKSRVGIDASGYAMSATTAHPEESFELIEFLLSKKAIEQVAASGLIVPARKDVAQSALFLAPNQLPKHGRAFLDVIPAGVPTLTPPRWNEVAAELELGLQPVWDGKQNAAEAANEMTPRLQRLIEVGGGGR